MSNPEPPPGSPPTERPPDDLCDMAFSCELMDDPVVAADGYTYNRKEILLWFTKHNVIAIHELRQVVLNFLKIPLRPLPKQAKFYHTKC